MNRDLLRKTFKEAQHSMFILLKLVGNDTICNRFILKWPDVIDSFIDDKPSLNEDIVYIVCDPIRIVTESLIERLERQATRFYPEFTTTVGMIMKRAVEDPFSAKSSMLDICNSVVHDLDKYGIKVEIPR